MKTFLQSCALALLIALPAQAEEAPVQPAIPAGHYTLDKSHASLIFRVSHLGFSNYTARFTRFDAQLEFDPAHLETAKFSGTVDPTSLETDYPEPDKLDFNAQLEGSDWLDAAKHPQITFTSSRIEMTGEKTARIHGELTLHGITKPLVIEATYNGGYAGHPMDPHARIGFSAHTTLNRSDFGISYGIPEPGTTMGVGDTVSVALEGEFSGPPLAAPSP